MQQPSKALIGVAVLLSLIGAGCTADLNDSLNAGAPADEASQAAAAKPADLDRLLSAFGPGGGVPDIEPLDKYQNAEPGMVSVNLFNSRLSSTNATMEVLVIDPAESGGPFHDYLLLGSQAGGFEHRLYAFKNVPAGHYIKSVQVRGEAGRFFRGIASCCSYRKCLGRT
jgi:hypothetical protein